MPDDDHVPTELTVPMLVRRVTELEARVNRMERIITNLHLPDVADVFTALGSHETRLTALETVKPKRKPRAVGHRTHRTFKTLTELVAAIESRFNCINGAFSSRTELNGEWYTYVTLSYRSRIHNTDEIQKTECGLRDRMFEDLMTIHSQFVGQQKPTLIWRFHEDERIGEEMHSIDGVTTLLIRTRVAIPGARWSELDNRDHPVPEGGVIPEIKLL